MRTPALSSSAAILLLACGCATGAPPPDCPRTEPVPAAPLMHGLMDENVHFRNTANLIDALMAEDKLFDLFVFPGERHGYRSPVARRFANRKVISYLVEHL